MEESTGGKGSWTGLLYVHNTKCDEVSDRRSIKRALKGTLWGELPM